MKKKQFIIFFPLVIAAVFLLAAVSVPRISAQEGMVVRPAIVSEKNIPGGVSANTQFGKFEPNLSFPRKRESVDPRLKIAGMTNGQTRQEFNEGYTNMLGALPTGVEAERKITFQKQSSAAPSFTLPYLVSIPKPVHYPKSAIRQGWEGEVVTALEILPDGSVGRSGLAESSGYDVLDQTALREAKTWQFSPALKNGKPITEYIQIPIKFKLQSD